MTLPITFDHHAFACTVVPHVTNEIQDWVERVAKIPVDTTGLEPEVCVIEVWVVWTGRRVLCVTVWVVWIVMRTLVRARSQSRQGIGGVR